VLRRLARLFVFAASLSVSGCLSPALPLPPPEPTFIEAAATPGRWIVSGQSNEAHALIVIQNERTNDGVSTTSDGATRAYKVEIDAKLCDSATVLELDEGSSEVARTPFVIQPTRDGFGDRSCQ
jgi:hypothetical protein